MTTYCFALDLKDVHEPIAEYQRYHNRENVWPAVRQKWVPMEKIFEVN